jgi:hypothetical protein
MKCVLALLGVAAVASDRGLDATGSPVEKVVKLITDVRDRTVADGKAEQALYDKYACWCENTAKRKAAAIEKAQKDLRSLGQLILTLKGKIAVLTAEIAQLEKDIKKNIEEQDLATSIRQKENAEYVADTDERKQAIAAMQEAVETLIAGTSLIQADSAAGVSNAVKLALAAMPAKTNMKPEHLSLMQEFATSGASATKYAPQSATIMGILGDMYNTFSTDLEEAVSDEASANRKFEDYIYEKQVELHDLRATKQNKEEQKAEAETLLADTTQEYDDTEAQKEADIEFFDETKGACEKKNEEWVKRKDLRDAEIAGMNEALEILTSDEARELFAKAIKPGKETMFLQISSEDDSMAPQNRAYAALKKAASHSHSLRLAQVAASVKLAKSGHFDAVIASINEIIQNLRDEDQADIEKRDECKATYQEIESTVKDLEWKIRKNDAKVDKLEKLIAQREKERLTTIEEIEEVTAQMEAMAKQRKEEHEAFQAKKSDDEGAIELLEMAKKALTKYYKENKLPVLLQGIKHKKGGPDFARSEDAAPEFEFSDKGSRSGESKGIVSLMDMLIEDLEDEIKNGLKDEATTQEEHEKEMKKAENLKEELIEKKTNLEDSIAKREEEKSDEHADKGVNLQDKMDENEYKAEIKPDCDWIIKSFTDRHNAREAEMNGLMTAKEYLAGAKVPSLLQKKGFNDDALSNIGFLGLKK